MLKQPVTQVRLTNVAVIRLKRAGKRFEIACYKNKILNWRGGSESDISEVLQTDSVFSNVSKGQLAKSQDLQRVFGTRDTLAIAKIILEKGELQVSEKERELAMRDTFRDICSLVAERIFSRQTCLPLPLSMVETSLINLGFSVSIDTPAKRQSLKAVDLLCRELPHQIARTQMALRITATAQQASQVKEQLQTFHAMLTSEQTTTGTAGKRADQNQTDKCGISGTEASDQQSKLAEGQVGANADAPEAHTQAADRLNEAQSSERNDGQLDQTSLRPNEPVGLIDQKGSDREVDLCIKGIDQPPGPSSNPKTEETGSLDLSNKDSRPAVSEHYMVQFLCLPTYYRDIDHFVTQGLDPPGSLQVVSYKECIVNPWGNRDDTAANIAETLPEEPGEIQQPRQESTAYNITSASRPPTEPSADGSAPCRTCETQVQSVSAYRNHCKTDWHQFNVKRKFKKLPPVSLEEFEDLAEDFAEGFLAVD